MAMEDSMGADMALADAELNGASEEDLEIAMASAA